MVSRMTARPAMQASPFVSPLSCGRLHLRSATRAPRLLQLKAAKGSDEDEVPASDMGSLPSARGSALSILRSGFVEALAAIAAVRFKANDAAKEELRETWLSSRSMATTTPPETDTHPSLLEQSEVQNGAGCAKPELTSPGFSFSAAGLLFPYHLGVGQCLMEHGCITEKTPLSGSSAGALVSAVIASGVSMADAMLATKELASDCRKNGTAFRLGMVLRRSLEICLPEDAHIRSSGRIRVAITQVFRSPKSLLVEHFLSKEDLINALLTSCFIPGYFAPRPVTLYRNRICMDGGLTSFMPPTSAEITVRVCAFPATQLGLKDIGISPDCNPPQNRASTRQLLNWALEPAADSILENLFDLGYQDALVWITQHKSSAIANDVKRHDDNVNGHQEGAT